MVGEHVVDDAPGLFYFKAICAWESGSDNESLPQCPTTTSRPGRVIEGKRSAERLPAFLLEERPRDRQIACGIAHARRPKVDNGAQPTPLDQQVPYTDVTVEPDRRILPGGRKCRFPDLRRGAGVDGAIEGGDP